MDEPNLKTFGTKLRQLRTAAGFYQDELAEKLIQIHRKKQSNTDLRLDGNRVSKWERGYIDKGGRPYKPRRQHMLCLIEIFSDQLNPDEAYDWAWQAGYQLTDLELEELFPPAINLATLQPQPKRNLQRTQQRLNTISSQRLFGVEREQQQLQRLLERAEAPWIIAVDGIGGIGKTSLANGVAREIIVTERFFDIAWVSAKQEEFSTGDGLQVTERPALDVNTLIDNLLEQLAPAVPLVLSTQEKQLILSELLNQRPYLLVIDNLETVVDYQALLPHLRQWVNPSKFLLTSRRSLHGQSDVFCLSLNELSQADTLDLLKHEADVRGLTALAEAAPSQQLRIYQVTGGNPLALKLVIGQICVLPLSQVLENLKEARGQKVDQLYTYIYWQAWHELDPASRQILLIMPLAQGGNLDQITALCDLEPEALGQALERLISLSLVEVSGEIDERRYRIHRLTETFLLNEVAKWQPPP
jgi:transcriptional regulator with XRE-family HTH domain